MKQINYIKGLLLILSFTVLQAQQEPEYTQYMYNLSVINPAYSGSKEALSLGVLGRKQWVGVNGSPETLTAFAHGPLRNSFGLGGSVIFDKTGPVTEVNAYADASYTIHTSDVAKLAFGLKAGITSYQVGLVSLTQLEPNDPLFVDNQSRVFPNFGAGVFYYTDDYYLGLSVPNLLETTYFKKNNGMITRSSEEKHFFLTGGYSFPISDRVKFKPSFMSKFSFNTPLSLDISANVLFQERIEGGLSYRWDDSIIAMVNLRVSESLWVGYAYDYTLSDLGSFNSGSHELMVIFDFRYNRGVKSPRYF